MLKQEMKCDEMICYAETCGMKVHLNCHFEFQLLKSPFKDRKMYFYFLNV